MVASRGPERNDLKKLDGNYSRMTWAIFEAVSYKTEGIRPLKQISKKDEQFILIELPGLTVEKKNLTLTSLLRNLDDV